MTTATASKQAGVLHWGKREQIDYRQAAWEDITTFKVPYSGEMSISGLQKALWERFPAQSSWGRLRWFSGLSLKEVSEETHSVLIEEHVGLCD